MTPQPNSVSVPAKNTPYGKPIKGLPIGKKKKAPVKPVAPKFKSDAIAAKMLNDGDADNR